MKIHDYIKECLRTVMREELPGIINNTVQEYITANNTFRDTIVESDIVRIDQVRKLTGYSIPTIYAKVSRDEIPCLSRGRPLLFSQKDIMLWITAGRPKNGNMKKIEEMTSKKENNDH